MQRFYILCDLHYSIVIEIQSGNRIIALGMLRLLLDGKCLAVLIKFHYTVFSGITHIIAENSCALFSGSYSAQYCGKALSVENIISQYQCHSVITDEIRTDDKGICQPRG